MADVDINKFRASVVRDGSKPASPGFIVSEGQDPVNPPGTNNYVPYSGATANVELGEYGVEAGFVTLDTTPTNTPTDQGTIFWDADDETVDIVLNGYTMKIGEDLFYPVKNQTGSTIAKGVAVRFNGTVGNSGRLLIAPFIADGSVASSRFMGVTAEEILNGEDGKVLYFGRVRGINTNAFNEGDILYASTTVAGGYQTAIPVAPNNIVQVAAVVTKSATVGTIFVRPTLGSNINTDEGVKITSVADKNLLQYQSGTSLWENKSLAQVLGGTSSQFVKGDGSLDSNTYGTGTVTSVGLSSATSGVTIGSTPVTTSGTITLAIATASGSQNGLLSSTDWTTFNNKQNALTNPVTGTGTTNYLPKFTGSTTIGNSLFTDNGTNGGIGGANYASGTDVRSFNISAPLYAGLGFWANNVYIADIFGYSVTGNLLINADPTNVFTGTKIGMSIDGTERLSIFSNGNVSIGNSPTDNGAKFQVSGTANINGLTTISGNLVLTNGANRYVRIGSVSNYNYDLQTTGDDFQIIEAGGTIATPRLTIKYPNGNVGINTTTPATTLEVNGVGLFSGGSLVGNTKNGVYIYDQAIISLAGTNPRDLQIQAQNLRFFTGTTYGEKVRIFTDGNVLIQDGGTFTNNGARLQVSGAATFSSTLRATEITASMPSGNGALYINNSSLTNKNWTFIPQTSSGETDLLLFYTGAAAGTRLTVTNSGNVLIGTGTDSGINQSLQIVKTGNSNYLRLQVDNNAGYDCANFYTDGTNSVFAGMLRGSTGLTGAFSIITGGATRFNVTSSGNVGIGNVNPGNFNGLTFATPILDVSGSIQIKGIAANGVAALQFGGETYRKALIYSSIAADTPYLAFGIASSGSSSSASEVMRINSSGFLKASNTGTYASSTAPFHELMSNQSGNNIAYLWNTSASPYGPYVRFSGAAPNNGTNYYFYCDDTSAARFIVYSNGGISNYQANNTNLSDERTKKEISPLESYWDKFKSIEIVKFKYKDQTHDDFNIGVIAQQVEKVAPEFVDVDGWDNKTEGNEVVSQEEPIKSIYTADLHHATIKVLQEAMAKIEAMQKEIDTLKN